MANVNGDGILRFFWTTICVLKANATILNTLLFKIFRINFRSVHLSYRLIQTVSLQWCYKYKYWYRYNKCYCWRFFSYRYRYLAQLLEVAPNFHPPICFAVRLLIRRHLCLCTAMMSMSIPPRRMFVTPMTICGNCPISAIDWQWLR
jgi:hypothetical protein